MLETTLMAKKGGEYLGNTGYKKLKILTMGPNIVALITDKVANFRVLFKKCDGTPYNWVLTINLHDSSKLTDNKPVSLNIFLKNGDLANRLSPQLVRGNVLIAWLADGPAARYGEVGAQMRDKLCPYLVIPDTDEPDILVATRNYLEVDEDDETRAGLAERSNDVLTWGHAAYGGYYPEDKLFCQARLGKALVSFTISIELYLIGFHFKYTDLQSVLIVVVGLLLRSAVALKDGIRGKQCKFSVDGESSQVSCPAVHIEH
ncbi:hypothetical protein T439DRAFT_337825 [Meredithblackwellia eburnea MCA 4105]